MWAGRAGRIGLVLLVAVAALLSVTVTSASAARETFVDRANDAGPSLDIREVRVVNEDRVLIRTTFEHLYRHRPVGLAVYLDTRRNNPGPEYYVSGGLYRGTDWQAARVDKWRDRTPQLLVQCDVDLRLRYGRGGTATYDFDRACLRRPDEVRVAAKSEAGRRGPTAKDWAPRRETFYSPVDHH